MIKKVFYDGCWDDIKQNHEYQNIMNELETSPEEYYIGIDYASHSSNGLSVVTYFAEVDGKLHNKGTRIIPRSE